MLWRVRTTMADRPGSLAALAQRCGEQGVNILGLQIFPGVEGVTDELVLRSPHGWALSDVAALVEGAGGRHVTVGTCTEHALVDGPTRYLHALGTLAEDPTAAAGVLAQVLDAVPAAPDDADTGALQGSMSLTVGKQPVVLRRTTPFTGTEHARAAAFAEVAAALLEPPVDDAVLTDPAGPAPHPTSRPVVRPATLDDTTALVRMHRRCSADSVHQRYAAPLSRIDERFARRLLLSGAGSLVAVVGEEVVGVASVTRDDEAAAHVAILVEDGWQRRGLGTRLLSGAARLARGLGADEVVLRSRSHHPALMPLVFASGLRARIRLDGDTLVVTAGVGDLKPLTTAQPGRPEHGHRERPVETSYPGP